MMMSSKIRRPFAVLGGLSWILLCVGCGGGGGDGDGTPTSPLIITSTPTLDGPVGSSLSLGTDSSQRPDVGDIAGGEFVHSLFSFDISQLPAGAVIVSASMELTSTSTTGSPELLGGTMVIDHLEYGNSFPSQLNDITIIHQSGVALWDDVRTVGTRAFNVTSQVTSDQTAGRPRSQFRVRGLLTTNGDSSVDLLTFAGGESQLGNEPILTIAFQTP
jgi:hypothetical protein